MTVRIGESVPDQPSNSWTVMLDPVGNELCVMQTVIPLEPPPFHHVDDRSTT